MALLGTLTGMIALVCAIWVIYDVLVKNKGLSTMAKIIWIVCAFFFSIITAIVYYLMGRK